MTDIPKHERAPRKGAKKPPQPAMVQPASSEVEPIHYAGYDGLSEVATQLEGILKVLGEYHYNSTIGEHSLCLFSGSKEGGYSPLRLELEGDALDSIADSLKRIADAMAAHG
jgi:hypothetical protein